MVTRLVAGLGGWQPVVAARVDFATRRSKGGLYLCNWERVETWLQEVSFN